MTILQPLCFALLAGCIRPPSPNSEDARPRSACTFGKDCLCDSLARDPDLAFCEDFENPAFNGFPRDRFGYFDGNPFALAYNAVNHDEGSCTDCGYNIVATTEGQCEIDGETDCVLDGAQAFGHRFIPGETGGIVAEKSLEIGRTFGVTYAFKFSDNFVDPIAPLKSNEFGARNASCILGCTTWNAHRSNLPFGWALVGDFTEAEVLVGHQSIIDVGIAFGVDEAQYEWRGARRAGDDVDKVVNAPGLWACQQIHIRDWGTDHTEIRTWVNGKLVLHVRGLDMRGMSGPDGLRSSDLDDVGFMVLNHYYNEGYLGAEPAYRYEDNIVITRADEPVSCAQIGAGTL